MKRIRKNEINYNHSIEIRIELLERNKIYHKLYNNFLMFKRNLEITSKIEVYKYSIKYLVRQNQAETYNN